MYVCMYVCMCVYVHAYVCVCISIVSAFIRAYYYANARQYFDELEHSLYTLSGHFLKTIQIVGGTKSVVVHYQASIAVTESQVF